ncbi:MAG: formylglycine-generating enzyme family protein [Pseudomonadota bacterium]
MYQKFLLILFLQIGFASPALAGLMPKDANDQYELSFWESVRDSRHAGDYDAYLQAYPNGRFVALARARIERLRAGKPKPVLAPRPPRDASTSAARQWRGSQPSPLPLPTSVRQPDIAAAAAATAALTELETSIPATTLTMPTTPQTPVTALEMSDCPTCPILVALTDGGFRMGSNTEDPTERPAFHVYINTPFAIGKHEVTLGQWNVCITDGACPRVSSDASRPLDAPVRDVSWDDAQRYIAWLSKQSGMAYRLPTEAEWEYAARGGSSSRYWWGEQMATGLANCRDCGQPWSAEGPAKVGSFAANGFGLHDMSGSVWEWVSDCWHDSYQRAPSNGSSWEESNCRQRVLRGASWREGATQMPITTRFRADANVRQAQNGFRVARNLE